MSEPFEDRRAAVTGPSRDTRASFSHGFAFGAVSFLAGGVLALLTGIVTARLYGITGIGEFALAYAPTGAVWYLSTAREQPALVKALAPLRPGDPLVGGLFVAVFAFSTALTLAVAALAGLATWLLFHGPIYHPQLFGPALVSLGGYLLFTNPGWNIDTVLSAFRTGRQLFWIRLHQTFVYLLLAVALHFALPGVWGLVSALVASYATSLAHRLLVLAPWIRLPVPRTAISAGFSELSSIVRFGLKLTPGFLANGVSNESSTWILGIVSSVSGVGAFNRAWSVSQRFVEIEFRITEMLFPTLVERHADGDHEGFDRALVDSVRYVATGLLLPAAAAGGASSGVMALYGAGFARAGTAFAILLVLPALLSTGSMQAFALMAVNRPLATTVVALARTLVTIAAGVGFSLALGITGMAVAALLGGLVQAVLQYRATRAHVRTPLLSLWPARQLVGLLAAYLGGFGSSYALDRLVPQPGGLILGLLGGTLVYGAVLLLGGPLPRDRERFRRVLNVLDPFPGLPAGILRR